jgi:protein TonB
MFERSLVISQENHASAGQRWTAVASITLQVGLAGVLIALPLLHPESLAFRVDSPKALMPNLKMPKVKQVIEARSVSSVPAIPMVSLSSPFTAPRQIPSTISKGDDSPIQEFRGMVSASGVPDLLSAMPSGPARVVTVAPARSSGLPTRISQGVSAGLLLVPMRPVYPAIAKAAHVEGTVVVDAVISKSGAIESLHVVSGPEMLRAAAMDAIRAARYQPYRLNGEPTEVQTTVTVNFRIGS